MKRLKTFIAIAAAALTAIACENTDEGKLTQITVKPVEIEAVKGTYEIPFESSNQSAYLDLKVSCDADWVSGITVGPNSVTFDASNNYGDARFANFIFSLPGQDEVTASVMQNTYFSEYYSLEVGNITSYTCIANITPNPSTAPGNYYYIVLNKSVVDESLALETNAYGSMEFGEQVFQNELEFIRKSAADGGRTAEEWLKGMGGLYKVTSTGEKTEMPYGNSSPLSHNTDYYLICFGMTAEGDECKRTTPVVLKQFTTLPLAMVDMSFEARVSIVDSYNASVVMTPSTDEHYYFWTYISDFEFTGEDIKGDIYAVMENMVKNIKASISGGTAIESLLQKGKYEAKLNDLWEGTKYHIIAWGMDDQASPITEPVEVTTFETPSMDIEDDCTFTIESLEVKQSDFKFKVTPSKETTRYYVAPVHKFLTEGYTDDQFAQRVINMQSNKFEDGETWATTEWCFTGTKEFWANKDLTWVVNPNEDYVIFVFGVGPDGKRTTKVETIEVHTEGATQSDMTFEVKFDETKWSDVTFTVTPSKEDEKYLPFLIATSELDNGYRLEDGTLDDDAVMDAIKQYFSEDGPFAIDYETRTGQAQRNMRTFSNTEYSLLVCGYAGSNTTRFFEFKFKSPEIPFGLAENADIAIEKLEIFDGAALQEKYPEKWKGFKNEAVLYVKLKPSGNCKTWYAGVWQPASHFEKDGGIDYVARLLQMEGLDGNNIHYPDTEGWTKPGWNLPYPENSPWESDIDEGVTCSTVPWCFYCYAEDENGNYSELRRKYFKPRKTKEEIKPGDIYDLAPTEPYDFWSAGGLKSASVMTLPKTDVRMETIFKTDK